MSDDRLSLVGASDDHAVVITFSFDEHHADDTPEQPAVIRHNLMSNKLGDSCSTRLIVLVQATF